MTGLAAASVPLSTPDLWLLAIERSVMLAGLAIALGGMAGRAMSRHYKGRRPGPLPGPWAVRGCLLGLAGSAGLLITALAGPGLAAELARPAPDGLRSGGTAAIAFVELVFFALALFMLRVRLPRWSAVLLCGVVLAEGIRSHPEGIIPVAGAFVTYCHLFPAILWAGMLLYAIRAALAWRSDPEAARGIIGLYATAAAWLFAAVVVTGVISALIVLPLGSLGSALTTTYGIFLIAKAVLVCAAAGLALAGRAWLRRRTGPAPGPERSLPTSADGGAVMTTVTSPPSTRASQGTGPALVTRLELTALAAVLTITGVLTVLTPPAGPISGTSQPPASQPHSAPARHA